MEDCMDLLYMYPTIFVFLGYVYLIRLISEYVSRYFQTRIKSPSITELGPASGSLSGDDVIIIGENFPKNPRVFFSGKLATVRWSSATMILANAPPSDTEGPVDVKIEGQTSNSAPQYIYKEPDGRIIRAENPGERIVIHGTGFRKGTSVRVDGEPATDIEIVSDKELSACPPAATESGVVKLEVLTPNGSVYATTEFEYFQARKSPSITELGPPSGSLSGDKVTLIGENFPKNPRVFFSGKLATVRWSSATMILANAPPSDTEGPVDVKIEGQTSNSAPQYIYKQSDDRSIRAENPGERSGHGNSSCLYEYIGPTATDWSCSPSDETGGITITIFGTGFHKDDEVVFGASRTEFVSDKQLRVHVLPSPELDLVRSGPVRLARKIETLDVPYQFFIPRVNRIVPASGSPAGGNLVAVIGEGFIEGHEVMLGDKVASDVEFVSDTTLIVRVPPSAVPGPVSVVIKGYEHATGTDSPGYHYEDALSFKKSSEISAAADELQYESQYFGDAPVLL